MDFATSSLQIITLEHIRFMHIVHIYFLLTLMDSELAEFRNGSLCKLVLSSKRYYFAQPCSYQLRGANEMQEIVSNIIQSQERRSLFYIPFLGCL